MTDAKTNVKSDVKKTPLQIKAEELGLKEDDLFAYQDGDEVQIFVGIDGYRKLNKGYIADPAVYQGVQSILNPIDNSIIQVPVSCLATLRSIDHIVQSQVVFMEFYQKDSPYWNKMPHHMIAKVGEAQCHRKLNPILGGTYIIEEYFFGNEFNPKTKKQESPIDGKVVKIKELIKAKDLVSAKKELTFLARLPGTAEIVRDLKTLFVNNQ